MSPQSYRSAVHISAIFGFYLSCAMLVPAFADFYSDHRDWIVFARASFFCGAFFAATVLATRDAPAQLNRKMGFLLVNLLWVVFSLVGAVPLWLSSKELNLMQAVFESVSAVTTTGSTVMVGLDHAAPGVLLWRSMLQWFGGIGIVALGLFVMPFLRVGGISFLRMESSDTNEKVFARIATFMRAFVMIYVAITLACSVAYHQFGMTQFDALNHAMTTVATGGFSTHDASFGHYDSVPLLWASTFFMTLCSLPFSVLILFVVKRSTTALRDPQILVFLGYLAVMGMALAAYHRVYNGVPFATALSHSFFNLASILSTSGYASEDYTLWGPFAVALAFFATFAGGCSGSTAGGIKAYRFVILFGAVRPLVTQILYLNSVTPVRYGGATVDPELQRAVFLFFAVFLALWAFGTLALGALGHDFTTAASSVITALSNVGPGVGPVVGPAGNFSTMSDPALAILSVLMIMGRLEVMTVLVLVSPIFWRS
ncbi:TrkH family potassium uptake protein (plasmid) [Ensifer adhaerens]|uniref:TrkH family potassium uptake protein n=1 Tax=Ensifer adhaerens TaxID=106592 RepID=UPI002100BF5E|nr:TrkH family potassium uptake protein [Ensifer adhaerens]UTV41067.1 TrkH family potassium uptake protein [Ensifer adhaerens]